MTHPEIRERDPIWLKFYDEDVSREIEIPSLIIPDFLNSAARRFPNRQALAFMLALDKPSVVFAGGRMTYAQLKREVDYMAGALADLGIEKGDRVAIMLPNCPQLVIAYFALLSIGAVVVLTNPVYTERELIHQWSDSGAEIAIVLDMMLDKTLKVKDKTAIEEIIVTGVQDYFSFPIALFYQLKARVDGSWVDVPEQPNIYRFKQLIAQHKSPPEVDVTPEDLACLQYTGGTTGLAKGAMLSHCNLVSSVTQIREFLLQGHEDATDGGVAIIPMFHVYGLAMMNLAAHLAAKLVLLPLPDIRMLVESIKKERPTFFLGVPALFVAVNNYKGITESDLNSIKVCFSGGAPLPVDVIENFERLTGSRIAEAYGMTETASVTHVNPRRGMRKYGSVGVPIVGTDSKIVDANDYTQELGIGEEGEMLIKGPTVMSGYWNQPEETAHVLHDGWLSTGDIAKMDEDGYFWIMDRKKDLILSGGFNVYPREVEDVLYQHTKVKEAAVIGIPSGVRGEKVKAFVVLKEGEEAKRKELLDFCRERLAHYKVPRAIEFRKELPKSAARKILRRALRDEEIAKLEKRGERRTEKSNH